MIRFFSILIIALFVTVDQILKILIDMWLKPMEYAEFLPGIARLSYVENKGAAFGILQNHRWIFIVFTAVVAVTAIILILFGKIKSNYYLFCVIMIVSGGVGNLIDRIFRGYVIDYIELTFMNFAVFNFADCLVTVGAALLIIRLIVEMFKDSKTSEKPKKSKKVSTVSAIITRDASE